jgi:hypothetical protein
VIVKLGNLWLYLLMQVWSIKLAQRTLMRSFYGFVPSDVGDEKTFFYQWVNKGLTRHLSCLDCIARCLIVDRRRDWSANVCLVMIKRAICCF